MKTIRTLSLILLALFTLGSASALASDVGIASSKDTASVTCTPLGVVQRSGRSLAPALRLCVRLVVAAPNLRFLGELPEGGSPIFCVEFASILPANKMFV
jgi:hypothetical protein